MKISKKKFDSFNGKDVTEYIIQTEKMQFSFLDFGARIHKILTDKNDVKSNIILSVNTVKDYIESGGYFGATVGRIAGRISKGKFCINNNEYQLEQNDGINHLHGGNNSIDKQIWITDIKELPTQVTLIFSKVITSIDDGYPGNIKMEVHHTITEDNNWRVEYFAESDEDTIFNPTNHVYFNLNQDYTKKIDNHILTLNNDKFAEIDKSFIPTGKIKTNENFNFKLAKSLYNGINKQDEDNKIVNGFDHPFILEEIGKKTFTLENDMNNIKINVTTDKSCVVVYTSNMLDFISSDGIELGQYCGVTLETQELPDAINHEGFGNTILKKNERYYSYTNYEILI